MDVVSSRWRKSAVFVGCLGPVPVGAVAALSCCTLALADALGIPSDQRLRSWQFSTLLGRSLGPDRRTTAATSRSTGAHVTASLGRKYHDVRLVQREDDAYRLRIPAERNRTINAVQFGAERRHTPHGVGLHAAFRMPSTSSISASDSPSQYRRTITCR
jgi:hypothetical protein